MVQRLAEGGGELLERIVLFRRNAPAGGRRGRQPLLDPVQAGGQDGGAGQVGVQQAAGRTGLDPGGVRAGRLHAQQSRPILQTPGDVGGAEGVGAAAAAAVDGGGQEGIDGVGVSDESGHELETHLTQTLGMGLVSHDVLPGVLVDQRHVDVAPVPGVSRPRLGHEGGHVAVLVGDLLDTVLECERLVGTVQAAAGGEVDLPLRSGVLAVGGDDLDSHTGHQVHDPVDGRDPLVADHVEDVVALEQALVALPVEEVELELAAGHRFESHAGGLLEHAPVDGPWSGLQGLAVVPARIADQAGRVGRPGHDRGCGGVREQELVAVAHLLVVQASGHDIGAGIEHRGASVHVEALAREAAGGVEGDDLGAGSPVEVG